MRNVVAILGVIGFVVLLGPAPALAQENPMTFFLTGDGPGDGGNLGGLAGADAHCQMLAAEFGGGDRTWHAYLSTQGPNAVNARDRIGTGPWHNAVGDLIGNNVDEIHGLGHRINIRSALDPEGSRIPDGAFTPNRHDILTGSTIDGMAYPAGEDMTCGNWTSNTTGKARVGHHDRANWLSAHDTQACSQESFPETGGDGLFYCFAID
jgi:hypothetical protein